MSQKKTRVAARPAARTVAKPLAKAAAASVAKAPKKAAAKISRPGAKKASGPKAKPVASHTVQPVGKGTARSPLKTSKKSPPAKKTPASAQPKAKPAGKPAPALRRNAVPPAAVVASPAPPKPTVRFSDNDLEDFRKLLMKVRNDLSGKVAYLRDSSLRRDDEVNHAEDGSDAFDRLFSLEHAGGMQKRIYLIDEALREIDDGTYGICQSCTSLIRKPRLLALPFARNCIQCQAEEERKRNGQNAPAVPRRFVP
jgi:DnaK suppressor protein